MRAATIVLLALALTACEKDQWDDCFTSTGPMDSEARSISGYTHVELNDRIDLEFVDGPPGTVIIEGGRNLLAQVRTEVNGNTLHIENGNKCNWMRRFDARITVRLPAAGIAGLTVRGTGNVTGRTTITGPWFEFHQQGAQGSTCLDIDVDSCLLKLYSGAGDLTCTGRAHRAELFIGSFGSMDCSGLEAHDVFVGNAGSVDLRCHATSALYAGIYGTGDIYYTGQPGVVEQQIMGSGTLIPF